MERDERCVHECTPNLDGTRLCKNVNSLRYGDFCPGILACNDGQTERS